MFDLVLSYSDKLIAGAAMTLQLTLVSVSLAALIALPLALMRHQKGSMTRYPIRFYVSFFRGTPLIAQLFLVYYGSGQFRHELSDLGLWWLFRDPLYCALLTFTLNSAAYQIEILRGALQAVPKGEVEAGRATGMKASLLYRRIILPHAYRIAFPALGNEVILMMKGGAIASVITILDIMGQTKRVFAQTFDVSVYLWAAIIYLLMTSIFVWLWRKAEFRLSRHLYRI